MDLLHDETNQQNSGTPILQQVSKDSKCLNKDERPISVRSLRGISKLTCWHLTGASRVHLITLPASQCLGKCKWDILQTVFSKWATKTELWKYLSKNWGHWQKIDMFLYNSVYFIGVREIQCVWWQFAYTFSLGMRFLATAATIATPLVKDDHSPGCNARSSHSFSSLTVINAHSRSKAGFWTKFPFFLVFFFFLHILYPCLKQNGVLKTLDTVSQEPSSQKINM